LAGGFGSDPQLGGGLGEALFELFQHAQNRPTLVLADAADRSVFEVFPHLLELAADGSTSGGGLDDERTLVVGVAGTPHESRVCRCDQLDLLIPG
jgi:hypothetical protein